MKELKEQFLDGKLKKERNNSRMNSNESEIDEILSKIYYTFPEPLTFSNFKDLSNEVKKQKLNVNEEEISDWLKKQDVHTLHRQRRLKFSRLKYNVSNIDDLWQIDLMDMQNISNFNRKHKYILAVIDTFSKFAWCVPITTKTTDNVIKAFEKIFKGTKRRPINICSDRGREFVSNKFKSFLKKHSINFYTANDPATKASVCERFIRTIKSLMYKYFTHAKTKKYLDVLYPLVDIYNNRIHRTIGMKPSEVNEFNVLRVWNRINKNGTTMVFNSKPVKFTVGTNVRISNPKQTFEKGYEPLWSKEIFLVDKVILSYPHTYRLRDGDGELLTSLFYEHELQKVGK